MITEREVSQNNVEYSYIGNLFTYPALLEEQIDLRLFTSVEHQRLVSALVKSYDKDSQEINQAKLLTLLKPDEIDYLISSTDSAVATDIGRQCKDTLLENLKIRTLEQYLQKVGDNEMSLDEFASKVMTSCKIHDKTAKPRLTGRDYAKYITSFDEMLKFDQYPNLMKFARLAEGTLTTIAAYTSRGKSALAMNLANDLRKRYKVIYFNLEMPEKQFERRLVGMNTGIRIFDQCGLTEANPDWRLIEDLGNELNDGNFIVYHGTQSAESIRSIVLKERTRPIVFVDHIQYLTGDSSLTERERISKNMKILNGIAKDGRATVFVLAQINREGEKSGGLSNLQGSSSLEQDSDNVLIIKPSGENEEDGFGMAKTKIDVILSIDKCRDGTKGKVNLTFDKPIQKFTERK